MQYYHAFTYFIGDSSVFIAISTPGSQLDSLSDLYVLRKLGLKFDYHKHSQLFNVFFIYKQSWSDDTHPISIGVLFSEFLCR